MVLTAQTDCVYYPMRQIRSQTQIKNKKDNIVLNLKH